MVPLTEATKRHVRAIFSPAAQDAAMSLLERECGDNLPFCERATPESAERIRFAALKMSRGDLAGLAQAVDLAKIDWRDLLMAAGFGCDTDAHRRWRP